MGACTELSDLPTIDFDFPCVRVCDIELPQDGVLKLGEHMEGSWELGVFSNPIKRVVQVGHSIVIRVVFENKLKFPITIEGLYALGEYEDGEKLESKTIAMNELLGKKEMCLEMYASRTGRFRVLGVYWVVGSAFRSSFQIEEDEIVV